MKTTQTLLLGAVAALLTTATVRADFSVKDLSNRAIASSPRAKEQYPWLTRAAATHGDTVNDAETTLRKNRALASSPRMREQFPALVRVSSATPAGTTPTMNTEIARVLENRAYAASPRTIEQFPWLARGITITNL